MPKREATGVIDSSKPERWRLIQINRQPTPHNPKEGRSRPIISHRSAINNRSVSLCRSWSCLPISKVDFFKNPSLQKFTKSKALMTVVTRSDPTVLITGIGIRRCVEIKWKRVCNRSWEVGLGFGSTERPGSAVVRECSFLRGVKCTQPNPRLLPRVAYFSCVSPPWPLSNTPVVSLTWGRHWEKQKQKQNPKRCLAISSRKLSEERALLCLCSAF